MGKLNKIIISVFIIIISVIINVVSYIILPNTLITQITFNGSAGNTMAKLPALFIPFILSVLFSVLYYKIENKNKYLFVAVLGIIINILILIFNFK